LEWDEGEGEGQVQILKIIANDFIRDTDSLEHKARACKARTLR